MPRSDVSYLQEVPFHTAAPAAKKPQHGLLIRFTLAVIAIIKERRHVGVLRSCRAALRFFLGFLIISAASEEELAESGSRSSWHVDRSMYRLRKHVIPRAFRSALILLFLFLVVSGISHAWHTMLLRMKPTTTIVFSEGKMPVLDHRVLHLLARGSFLDDQQLEWIRATPFVRLQLPITGEQPIHYTWFNGERYTVLLRKFLEAARERGEKHSLSCFCAAHFGLPLHAVVAEDVLYIEPRIVYAKLPFFSQPIKIDDALGWPHDESFYPLAFARITHLRDSNVLRGDVHGTTATCIARCISFATRSSVFDDSGKMRYHTDTHVRFAGDEL